jgi:hypothetical protein
MEVLMRRAFLFACLLTGCGDSPLTSGLLPDMSVQGPGPGEVGAPCANDTQCNLGVCLDIGRCSHVCPLPACDNGWVCAPEGARNVCQCPTVTAETCNGIDDDCNGIADDNAVCPTGSICRKGACECVTPGGSNHLKLVASRINLPKQRSDFAVDLNGDGKADNQYGNIIGALASQNLNPQTTVDQEVASGKVLLLTDLRSNDPAFASDTCAGAVLTNALPQATPNFTGSGTFTVDPSVMAGNFAGTIQATFSSIRPATATTPVTMEVYLPLFSLVQGTPSTKIKLTAVWFSLALDLKQGWVAGVIRKADLDTATANSAVLLDQQVQANPTSSTNMQILQIFDTGGEPAPSCGQTCVNPDGTCAVSGDGHISVCEVTTNSIVRNVLAPDLDMFDAAGNYHPNPANTDKDSLSVGFGFQAVGANF